MKYGNWLINSIGIIQSTHRTMSTKFTACYNLRNFYETSFNEQRILSRNIHVKKISTSTRRLASLSANKNPNDNGNNFKNNNSLSEHVKSLGTFKLIALSGINGVLYFAIAKSGGANLQELFSSSGSSTELAVLTVSGMASLCYIMFFYKTLESLNLSATTPTKKALAFFAPFSASAFLTGGIEGSALLGLPLPAAISIGMTLFFFRIINCIDGSVKFPDRVLEMKKDWDTAWLSKDRAELARLILTGVTSIGYSISTTDPIYAASQTIASWLSISATIAEPYSYMISIFGAIGTLPMTLYWTHRGLKQLTYGGRLQAGGKNPDPTDWYTYLSLFLVLPVTLGILGAATSANGKVFAQLGVFAEMTRVSTSVIYATCAGLPGMSTLLRSLMMHRKTIGIKSIIQKYASFFRDKPRKINEENHPCLPEQKNKNCPK